MQKEIEILKHKLEKANEEITMLKNEKKFLLSK